MIPPARVTAVVLAAGAASRFGGGKLLAPLEGRPLLQHVLDTLRRCGLGSTVVVLGGDAAAIEAAVAWQGERRVRNPAPEEGLAGSLRVGMAAVEPAAAAVLVLLGDQPLVAVETIAAILAVGPSAEQPVVVPRYADGGGRNPVLLGRAAFHLAAEARGDRGLGPVLAAHAELIREVPVAHANPDVDTPGDLAAVAWARRVVADREQVERIRVAPDAPDFYASTTSSFRVDPRREDDPVLEVLLPLAHPGETWLDVGAGAGRFALPLALRVAQVIAVEPSPGMRAALEEDAAAHGIGNVRAIDARWPMSDPPHADVALIANVGHDVEAIGPFIDALEAAAPRCVAIMTQPAPAAPYAPLWPPLHGEERILLPAFDDLVALVEARGAATRTWRLPRPAPPPAPFDRLLAMARRQTWIPEGDPREGRLVELLKGMAAETPEGWVVTAPMGTIGVVEWRPAGGVA